MSELREELARRLVTVFMESIGGREIKLRPLQPGEPITFSLPQNPEAFPEPPMSFSMKPLADECLRQMEWARRECVTAWQPDYDECELDFSVSLSLAPEDWKP